MKQQNGFVLVSVLIITTITTMLAFSQLSENRLQERIAGSQQKEIKARLAAEKGMLDAFDFIAQENAANTSNGDIKTGLNNTPYTNAGNVSTLQDIVLVDNIFTFTSKGLYHGSVSYLKTSIEAIQVNQSIFDNAIVGCESVTVWGAGIVEAFSEDGYGNRTNGLDASVSVIGDITDKDVLAYKAGSITGTTSEYFGECDPLNIQDEMESIDAQISTQGKSLSSITDEVTTLTETGGSMTLDILGVENKSVYVFSDLTLNTNTITIDGDVTIYIEGAFNTGKTGDTIFKLADKKSSLTILTKDVVDLGAKTDLFTGASVTTDENGIVRAPLTIYSSFKSKTTTINNGGKEKDETTTAVSIQGNGSTYANVYAPRGVIEFLGTTELFGALRGEDVYISGTGDMHYDKGLADITDDSGSVAKPSLSSAYYYYPDD
jgi:hypothetical protein